MKAAPIRALLIEDNPADAEIVREMLAKGARARFEIEVAERLGSGIEALHQDHFDVVLADLNLPDSYGLDTFRALQECCPDTPIILLTGLEDEGIAEQALKQGAQDYLVKSQIDARSLDRSIRYAIERKHILRENVRLYDEAERASRAKDEFLAMLSHELRTPLTAVLGWAVLLRDGKLPPDVTERALLSIEQNARVQGRIVDELLDISRIITGKLSLVVEPLMLANVLQPALDSVRVAADAKNLTITSDLNPGVPPISGDPGRLQQILWNVLSNAIKFTPSGGRIDVALRNSDGQAEIAIRDSGVGIRRDVLPYIFDRFRQADSSTSRAYGGLGLGLAIVRHLVEMHGGTVEASSEGEGKGSEFRLRFPTLDSSVGQTVVQPAWLSFTSRLDGVRVLIVEDEVEHTALLKEILEQRGAHVAAAANAEEGFRLFKIERPDVLLTDIAMPAEDGYSLLRRLRAEEARNGLRRTPAAAITAYGREEDKSRLTAAGFDTYLAKPLEPAAVVRLVRDLSRAS